jgi:sugar transferase EpsL
VKRLFDIAVSLAATVVLSPILLITAVCVRVFLGGPVLFRQQRPGLNERLFTLYKFRTMKEEYDDEGNLLPDEDRLTPFGLLLRRTSIDELPELFNVIRGEMSLVGPRPLLPEYLSLYNLRQRRRHDVRPGITGWAQINGRNAASWLDRLELDIWYVENRSMMLDLKILASTISKVLRSEGINESGHATVRRFQGND